MKKPSRLAHSTYDAGIIRMNPLMRVAGADPGTSSLDLLILDDGAVADQVRFEPAQLQADPVLPVHWLCNRGPFDLIAGPSGYGLPLVAASVCSDAQLALMSLVRPDERDRAQGVAGFSAVARAFRNSGLPVVFLPGVIHLTTVPPHRKLNRVDLGTPDKLCVAALALSIEKAPSFCLVELGSAFTAILLLHDGQVVEGIGGTGGPPGWKSGGAWDGELAYLLSPLTKIDLFQGGIIDVSRGEEGLPWYIEDVARAVSSLRVLTDFRRIVLSGKIVMGDFGPRIVEGLAMFNPEWQIQILPDLLGAWVKQAAQGAALLADGLAGGRFAAIPERLRLREASGSVLDWIVHPRGKDARAMFLNGP